MFSSSSVGLAGDADAVAIAGDVAQAVAALALVADLVLLDGVVVADQLDAVAPVGEDLVLQDLVEIAGDADAVAAVALVLVADEVLLDDVAVAGDVDAVAAVAEDVVAEELVAVARKPRSRRACCCRFRFRRRCCWCR